MNERNGTITLSTNFRTCFLQNQRIFAFLHDLFSSWKRDRWFHVQLKEKRKRQEAKQKGKKSQGDPTGVTMIYRGRWMEEQSFRECEWWEWKETPFQHILPLFFSPHFIPTWSLFSRLRNRFENGEDLR